MIRFCDKEVCCVLKEELDRDVILNYFFEGHIDEVVCVTDSDGKYEGKLTYYTLINTDQIVDAVQKECVVLDHNIWTNARYYFSHYERKINEHVLLPVVDKMGQIICFAYEDDDANREIRMLRELSENQMFLQFADIYPECKFVKIYEFNELAYFFAKYLQTQNIAVEVSGGLWGELFESTNYQELDYTGMTIYAEGIGSKKQDWINNLPESVSVEFECIDHIYEINIKNNIIKDAKEGGMTELLNRLKGEPEIVIWGSGSEAQDVYNFLLGYNIDICCFMNENYGERSHYLFGKEILRSLDVRKKYRNPIFLECISQYSAWGFGGTDYYDYIGYKRNERFYLIKDYENIVGQSLLNILKRKNVVLIGDMDLCQYLNDFLLKNEVAVSGYMNITQQYKDRKIESEISVEDAVKDSNMLYLINVPESYKEKQELKSGVKRRYLINYLKEKGIYNFTEYFSFMPAYIDIEKNRTVKYRKNIFMPKKIILGSIEWNSGNAFFKGLIDGHPSVMLINGYDLNNDLFWYCIRLSMLDSTHILAVFWEMCKNESEYLGIYDPITFNDKMRQLLELDKKFTPQELFVMFHIAYMYMNGCDVSELDIKNMVIYWEPHHVERNVVEDFMYWLEDGEKVRCQIINIVRNMVMVQGKIKTILGREKDKRRVYADVLNFPSIRKKDYGGERLIVKFEDLKCNPRRMLEKICDKWGIVWADILMMTTNKGGREKQLVNNGEYLVSDFDIKPVYNINEKYFSEFDRFRIMLICAPWQKKYGYPYVDTLQFTKRELQEIFIKSFRFENIVEFGNMRLKREFKIELDYLIKNNLQIVRMMEIMNYI